MVLAMSEGWADFVALMLEDRLRLGSKAYAPGVLETPTLAPNPAVDRCVAAALWDLFDPISQESDGLLLDRVRLPFADLFRVYSPSMQVLTNGLVISSIYNFARMLTSNYRNNVLLTARIDEVLARNVGPIP
jgi:hypothetical protein